MNGDPLYVAIDVGAGFGAKIGLFSSPTNQFGEDLLPREEFADNIDDFVAGSWRRSSSWCDSLAGGSTKRGRLGSLRPVCSAPTAVICSRPT